MIIIKIEIDLVILNYVIKMFLDKIIIKIKNFASLVKYLDFLKVFLFHQKKRAAKILARRQH
jgi:hypothetical protein